MAPRASLALNLAVLVTAVALARAIVPADRVAEMPGFGAAMPSRQWSGYLEVQSTTGQHFFTHYVVRMCFSAL